MTGVIEKYGELSFGKELRTVEVVVEDWVGLNHFHELIEGRQVDMHCFAK